MHDSSIIDLHCHSTASDGTYAPKEVAALAQKIGLSAIALTDHDTIDGLAEFQAEGVSCGLKFRQTMIPLTVWRNFKPQETPSASKPSQALNLPHSGSISTVPKSILSA